MKSKAKKLDCIRQIMCDNVTQVQEQMVKTANPRMNPLLVQPGDYVYLHSKPMGAGEKLKGGGYWSSSGGWANQSSYGVVA